MPEITLLLRVACSLTGSKADAEDLVQETLLRAYRSIHDFDGEHPRAWLLTIMRNANIIRVRRAHVADPLNEPDALLERTSSDPSVLVERAEFDGAVRHAAVDLPPTFRDVVTLMDLDGLSYADAAAALGLPIGTVMSRLHCGRKRIRQRLLTLGRC